LGENFGGEEIQDLVSILRSQTEEYCKANIEYIEKMIKLQMLEMKLRASLKIKFQ
jgi:hypothetical protein